MRSDGIKSVDDVTDVRFPVFGERGGNTDNKYVTITCSRIVGGWLEAMFQCRGDCPCANSFDVAPTGTKGFNLADINIKAENRETALTKGKRKGEADITQPDNADDGSLAFQSVL